MPDQPKSGSRSVKPSEERRTTIEGRGAEQNMALLRAWRLVGEGRMAEAERRIDEVLARFPGSRRAWLLKSTAQFHRGNYAGGVESSERAIELDQSDPEGWMSKGLCLAEAGSNEAAIECYASAIQLDDNHADAWRETGKSLGRLNRNSEAVQAFDKSLKADPEAHETWYSLALSLVKLNQLNKALACYDKALRIDPRNVGTWCARAELFIEYANQKVRSEDREDRTAAIIYLREALRNLDNALKIDPEHDLARRNRALLIEQVGQKLTEIPSLEGRPGIPALPEL